MKKILPVLLIIIGLILIAAVLFDSEIYMITRKPPLAGEHKRVLYNLAREAEKNGDLPISSVLLKDYIIIGSGYNTVVSDSNLAGHAEINALNDAVKNIGYNEFMNLDRNSLILLSTLEPCEMCKGMLLHYNIKNVQFLKEKDLTSSIENHYEEFLYEVNKKQISEGGLLDSLKILHPDY